MKPNPTLTHTAEIFRCPVCKNPVEGIFTVNAELGIALDVLAEGMEREPTHIHVEAKTKITNLSVHHSCQIDSAKSSLSPIIDDLMKSPGRSPADC